MSKLKPFTHKAAKSYLEHAEYVHSAPKDYKSAIYDIDANLFGEFLHMNDSNTPLSKLTREHQVYLVLFAAAFTKH